MPARLVEADFEDAAKLLKCNVAGIKAVADVESSGDGFLEDGRVRVLFEGHKFFKYTGGRFQHSHPTLCFPKWTRAHYAKGPNREARGQGELARLEQAMTLDRQAALMSASYGKFQIMGFNFAHCAFPNVDAFYSAMQKDEREHLLAFCNYIIDTSLDDELRDHRWADFARRYNGPDYKKNRYDDKLAVAYAKHLQAKPAAAHP